MKRLSQCIPLFLAFFSASILEIRANGLTETFRQIWQRCQDESKEETGDAEGLAPQYDLYLRFLEDRCRRLGVLWKKNVQIDIIPCGSSDVPIPVPHCVVNPIITETVANIVFRIAWFCDYFNRDPLYKEAGSDLWKGLIRPLLITPAPLSFSLVSPLSVTSISPPPLGPLSDASLMLKVEKFFLANRSRMLPSVVLLHELTHLLLRMDFILAKNIDTASCRDLKFEQKFIQWVVEEVLCKIHPKFSESLSRPSATTSSSLFLTLFQGRQQPEETATDIQTVNLYQDCWGSRDEILVILGVKLLLGDQEHLLGETMLLRRIAQLKDLPFNFVCWSHCNAYLKGKSLVPKDGRNDFYKDLFILHREAWIALLAHLGFL